jgi:hypothetical protein
MDELQTSHPVPASLSLWLKASMLQWGGLQCRQCASPAAAARNGHGVLRSGRRSREAAVPRGDPRRRSVRLLDLTDFSAASAKVRRRQQEKAAATTRRAPRWNLRLWDLPQYAFVTDEASYSSHPVQVVGQAVLQPASSSPRQRRRAHRYAVSLHPVYLHLAISYSCLLPDV